MADVIDIDFEEVARIEQYLDEVTRRWDGGSTNTRAFTHDDHLKPLGALSTRELEECLTSTRNDG